VLAKQRIPDGLGGVAELYALVARHAEDPGQVVVGIETDRGLLIGALVAAGYQVYAVNPLAVSRYRDRHAVSGAKSDRGDAKVLADLVRTDRHNHRQVAGDSPLAVAVKVLARAQQRLVWTRQEQVNTLRSALREFYPGALASFGTDLAGGDALAVLALAPTPEVGRQLSQAAIAAALRQAGRRGRVQTRAAAIQAALRGPQLDAPVAVAVAYGQVVAATVVILHALNAQLAAFEEALGAALARHPQAPILRSQPGLGVVLAARLLGEFGDDPVRYATAKGRKAYAGTAPITRASGTRTIVSARVARTTGWPTPARCGRSPRSAPPRERGPAITGTAPSATATSRRCGRWAIGWSASCTAAWPATSSTTSRLPGPNASPLRPEHGEGVPGEGSPSPGVLAICSPRGRGAAAAAMPRGQAAGRRKLALCQVAAEGGSAANLFRRSGLTVATAATPAG
jgi:transposase